MEQHRVVRTVSEAAVAARRGEVDAARHLLVLAERLALEEVAIEARRCTDIDKQPGGNNGRNAGRHGNTGRDEGVCVNSTVGARTPGDQKEGADALVYVVFISAAAAMGGFLFGYDSSVINGAVEAIRGRYDIGSATLAQVVAIALIGCAVGAAIAGRVADRIGRIWVMRIAATLFTCSAIGSALPFALWDLAMWRVIGGIGIGMASVIGPAYIAEVSPPAYRGRLASFQQAAIVIGIATSQLVNFAILKMAGGEQRGHIGGLEAWQWMLGVMVVPHGAVRAVLLHHSGVAAVSDLRR